MSIEESNSLKACIEKIKKGFQESAYQNEASISRQAVEPILRELEWPTDNAAVVCYEYSLQEKKADIALLHKGKPTVIIEVKRLGAAGGAEMQLFSYVFHAGVSLAVLTTGKEWEFYLPLKPGDYQDRQVYKLDICARETEESVNRLMRYLFYPHLCSKQAIKAAEDDHGDKTRAKEIQDALPKAWAQVLSECDARLMGLLQDKVGDLCGFTPDADVVKKFIGQQAGQGVAYQPPSRTEPVMKEHTNSTKVKENLCGFKLFNNKIPTKDRPTAFKLLCEELTKRDPHFPDKFMKVMPKGGTISLMAKEKCGLFKNPSRGNRYKKLLSGHYIATRSGKGKNGVDNFFEIACKAADIVYMRDLIPLFKE